MHICLDSRFEKIGLTPKEVEANDYSCRWCTNGVPIGRSHCETCGGWPADQTPINTTSKDLNDKIYC